MQNEKQNRSLAEKMDDMQQIPAGFAFHPNTSWKEIENHLPKTRRRNFTWFYAAAMVLLVVGISYILLVKNAGTSVAGGPATVSTPKVIKTEIGQQRDIANTTVSTKMVSAKKTARTKLIITEEKIPAPVVPEPARVVAITPEEPPISVPLKQQEITVEKTPAPLVIAKPAIKKLRVVHLNELGGPPTDPVRPEANTASIRKNNQQAEEKDITLPVENTKQLLFFKKKPVITTTTIVENQ